MAKYASPGIYVVENDNSEYVPSINPSIVGIVGFASRGPVDKATLVTTQDSLVSTFGKPLSEAKDGGQGIEGAVEVLEATNSLYYIRCASGGVDASVDIPYGSCPAVCLSSVVGDTSSTHFQIQVKNGAGVNQFSTPLKVNVSAIAGDPGTALTNAFGEDIESSKVIHTRVDGSSFIIGAFPGANATLEISAWGAEGGTASSVLIPLSSDLKTPDATGVDTALTATGDAFADLLEYRVQSLYPGTGYNYTVNADGSIDGLGVTIDSFGGKRSNLYIADGGVTQEDFDVGLIDNYLFIEEEINTGDANLTSNLIKGNIVKSNLDVDVTALTSFGTPISSAVGGVLTGIKDPRFVKLVEGSYELVGGTDGIPATDDDKATALIGVDGDDGKTGMQLLNDDLIGITVASVPGFTQASVQNALVTLAESTNLFLAVVSPPVGISKVQDVIDWSNGLGVGIVSDRSSAISSSWAAIYWPWVKVFDAYSGKDKWYDPAIFAMRQMCVTDQISETWFAPAGLNRGRLTKPTDVEVRLTQGDRDVMYSGGNVINPIVNFPQQGIAIYGQRTAQRKPSALDRVNVRRMMIIIRKLILQSTAQYAFEPNDPLTWDQVAAVVTQLIDPIRRGRGITSYQVVCDSTTNTPDRIEKGQLWCKIFIRPTKTAEVVVFELNLTGQSVTTT